MTPRSAVAVFVKSPGLSPLKTRLAEKIGPAAAETFHLLSAQATEEVLLLSKAALHPEHELEIFWAVAEEEGLGNPLWQNQRRMFQGDGELGDRLSHVYDELLKTHDSVILLGADSPQLPAEYVLSAVDQLSRSQGYVAGPAADGGFYLFGCTQPIEAEIWRQVPYSTEFTLNELVRALEAVECLQSYPVLSDVDTFEEFCALRLTLLREESNLLPGQRRLLSFIEEVLRKHTRVSVY